MCCAADREGNAAGLGIAMVMSRCGALLLSRAGVRGDVGVGTSAAAVVV